MSSAESLEKDPQPAAFDAEWYRKFSEIGSFQAYEYLDGDAAIRTEQRRQFEAGEIKNPELDYPRLQTAELEQREADLLQLKQEILTDPVSKNVDPVKMEVVRQVYRWRLNEKIAENRLMQAAANGDTKRFKRYSEFIYGKPSPEIFAYTINSLHTQLDQYEQSDNSDLSQAARELREVLPTMPIPKVAQLPTNETVQIAREGTLSQLGHLINVPATEAELDAPAIASAFTQAIEATRGQGWKVVVDPNKNNISVNQEEQLVSVPTKRTMSVDRLKELILHEIGTHVARRGAGERTKLQLLGLGLDRYEGGEEGVATMREQALANQVEDFAGLEGHLAISLAVGVDGQPRDFRQVHEVMKRHFLVEELAAGKDLAAAQESAAKKGWSRTVRTFRGTNCATPGVAFTKDMIYREGNIGVWEVVRTNPSELKRFNVGKYDPTNERHLWVLTQLGITEDDLQELES